MDATEGVLASYLCDAADAIELKLVHNQRELEDAEASFRPEFTHQVVGQSEKIFGYKGLSVQLYYTASTLSTFLRLVADETVKPELVDGVKPDDPISAVAEWLPEGWTNSREEFVGRIESEAEYAFRPPGEHFDSFSVGSSHFEAYHATAESEGCVEFHNRLQTFLIWYIEAASFIDLDDPKWAMVHLYERQESGGRTRYCIVGFCTLYRNYAFPQHCRPRISQMLVLPPYQRQGHGARLLAAAYSYARSIPSVIDVTVEDPSPDFVRLRDYVDCRQCLALGAEVTGFTFTPAYPPEWPALLKKRLFIASAQARRVYEILWRHSLGRDMASASQAYRYGVKSRLMQPFMKQKSRQDREVKELNDEERAVYLAQQKDVKTQVHRMYSELMEEYDRVVSRLRDLR